MEGKVSVHQVNPVSQITSEGRAFLRAWRHRFEQEGALDSDIDYNVPELHKSGVAYTACDEKI